MRVPFSATLLLFSALIIFGCSGSDPEPTAAPSVLFNPTVAPTPSPTPTPSLTPTPPPVLTLDDIFGSRDLDALDLEPDRIRTIIATGDVMPGRYTDVTIRNRGDDFLYPVEATKDLTASADIAVVNLEAPIIEGCPYHDSGFTFCGRPGFLDAMTAAGIDIATLENNHIGNYGPSGMAETRDLLDAAGLAWADRWIPAIVDVRGVTFGFIAFNGVGESIDRAEMTRQIELLDDEVDVVVAAFHWGAEYVSVPQSAGGIAPDDPIEIAHAAVDAGADLVIGHHPHWVQAVELYNDVVVAYSHGNFIFDQMWSYETRVGVIGKYTFYDEDLVGVEFIPVLIEDFAQPVVMTGDEAQAVLDGMLAASEELSAALP